MAIQSNPLNAALNSHPIYFGSLTNSFGLPRTENPHTASQSPSSPPHETALSTPLNHNVFSGLGTINPNMLLALHDLLNIISQQPQHHSTDLTIGGNHWGFQGEGYRPLPENPASAPKNQTLQGTDHNETIHGSNSDDKIYAGAGNDQVLGQLGNDMIKGEDGHDSIDGGQGDDEIFGNQGHDHIQGSTGDDKLFGDQGNDALSGEQGDDYIEGGDGDDRIDGGSGNDKLRGQEGDDLINAGTGDDVITTGSGHDTVYAGSGDDKVYIEEGNNRIDGGTGDDMAFFIGSRADYQFMKSQDGKDLLATKIDSGESSVLTNIENICFDDGEFTVEELFIEQD